LLAIVQGLEDIATLEGPSRERIADTNLGCQRRRESTLLRRAAGWLLPRSIAVDERD